MNACIARAKNPCLWLLCNTRICGSQDCYHAGNIAEHANDHQQSLKYTKHLLKCWTLQANWVSPWASVRAPCWVSKKAKFFDLIDWFIDLLQAARAHGAADAPQWRAASRAEAVQWKAAGRCSSLQSSTASTGKTKERKTKEKNKSLRRRLS